MTNTQLPLPLSGKTLKEKGMAKALDTANKVIPGWGEECYRFFKIWIRKQRKPFKMESFRESIQGVISDPPSLRTFGAIARRAKKEGLIKHIDYTQTENPKSHAANCSLWAKV